MTEQWIFDTVKVIHAEIDRLRESGQLRETNSREEPKHIDRKYAALREAVSALRLHTRGHAVIYKNGVMVHDPHPSGDGLFEIEEVYIIERNAQGM